MSPITKHEWYIRKQKLLPYALVAPSLLAIIVFLLIPVGRAILISFTDAKLLTLRSARFIGLENYATFFSSMSFGRVIRATLTYVVGGVLVTYLLGLFTAVLLDRSFVGRRLVRTLLILPWVVPQVVLVIIWRWMLNPKFGVINYLLGQLGVIPPDFSWFSDPAFAMLAILLTTWWKQYPLALLILLAGLQSVPVVLYEAAEVDGANFLQKFFYITLPGLKYITTVLVLLLTIWHFGNFVIIWLMTQGGPADATATLTIFTYLNAFKFSKFGYGATIGVIILFVSLVFSLVYYKLFVSKLGKE